MDAEKSKVVLEVEEPIAIIRLNRPEKLNAFTLGMVQDIREAAKCAAEDERVVGVIITGEGRAFCAGLDTSTLARVTSEGALPTAVNPPSSEELPALFSFLQLVPKPVIAAINGVAAGGGFLLAMMSDLRFAAETASFTTAFSQRGLIAENGVAWVLPRLVGLNRALDLLWSARRIDAQEAYRIGFVDRVVPGDRLLDAAKAYITDLATNASPHSMALMKSQVHRDLSLSREVAYREADQLVRAHLGHADAKEGIASFLERRPPRFQRRRGH